MDAIKKKMQAMKMEKDAAMDKADTCEGQAKDANLRADKVKNLAPHWRRSFFQKMHIFILPNFILGYGRCPRRPEEAYAGRERSRTRQKKTGGGQQGLRGKRKGLSSGTTQKPKF